MRETARQLLAELRVKPGIYQRPHRGLGYQQYQAGTDVFGKEQPKYHRLGHDNRGPDSLATTRPSQQRSDEGSFPCWRA